MDLLDREIFTDFCTQKVSVFVVYLVLLKEIVRLIGKISISGEFLEIEMELKIWVKNTEFQIYSNFIYLKTLL